MHPDHGTTFPHFFAGYQSVVPGLGVSGWRPTLTENTSDQLSGFNTEIQRYKGTEVPAIAESKANYAIHLTLYLPLNDNAGAGNDPAPAEWFIRPTDHEW